MANTAAVDVLDLNPEDYNRKRARKISMVIHGILLLLMLLLLKACPHTPEKAKDKQFAITVDFTDIEFTRESSSNSTKSKAASGKSKPKMDPVTKIKENKVDQVKVTKPTPKVPKPTPVTPKPTVPVVSETTTLEESPIEAVEEEIEMEEPELEPEPEPEPIPDPDPVPEVSNNTPTNNSSGKTNSSNDSPQGDNPATTNGSEGGTGKGNSGDGPGSDDGGNDGDSGIGDGGIGTGEFDGSGNGIFGRKVVFVNRSKLGGVMNGVEQGQKKKIWVKTCVNRAGKVTYVELDEINTDVYDNNTLKKALSLVSQYLFEPDINAPGEQCGVVKINIDKTNAFNGN